MHPHVQCSTIHNSQDMETTQMSIVTDDWIRKRWYIYTMEYYSAIKKNYIMPFAATWMLQELETLTMSEISQKDNDKYYMISLITGI